MEKSYYLVTFRSGYLDLLRQPARDTPADREEDPIQRIVVAITQGGFGQDVVDDERQVKERFLEYLFGEEGIDLPRSAEVFDEYFQLDEISYQVDLDEEA